MGYVEDRVAEVEKVFDTRLGSEEVYAAIQRSAVAAKVAAGGGKLQELGRQEQEDGSDAVYFAVLMGIGVERGRIAVRWWPDRPGRHRVKVHVISYDTSQVAPLAPKTVPILRCVRRFVDALEVELHKAPAEGAATPTATSTQVAPGTGDPADEETDRTVELAEHGMSGGTLSDAELRELEAAGITAVSEPGPGLDEHEPLGIPAQPSAEPARIADQVEFCARENLPAWARSRFRHTLAVLPEELAGSGELLRLTDGRLDGVEGILAICCDEVAFVARAVNEVVWACPMAAVHHARTDPGTTGADASLVLVLASGEHVSISMVGDLTWAEELASVLPDPPADAAPTSAMWDPALSPPSPAPEQSPSAPRPAGSSSPASSTGAATPTATSTQVARGTGDPTDEETDRTVELAEHGMSGGTLSDAELRELEAAGITAVSEPGPGHDEIARTSRPTSAGNPSMAEARRRLVEEGFIDESDEGSAEQRSDETERPAKVDRPHAPPIAVDEGSADDGVARCASCESEVGGGDRFCRTCGVEIGAERRPAARHRAMDGEELHAALVKAQRAQAAGILVQVASLTTDQVNRILQEAEQAGPAFDKARDRAMQSANRGEYLAVAYCFRKIRDLVLPERLPDGRLEGMSKADEATVATMGSGAAVGYLNAKTLAEADRDVLLTPWLRAVGEPPPGDDLVELAVDDSRLNPPARSERTPSSPPSDPGLRKSLDGLSYPAPRQRPAHQPASRAAAQSARPSPRYVSDAQIGENFTVRQVLDGLCWMIAGIAAVVFGTQPEFSSGWVIAGGLAAVIYGLRVLFGGGSYWVSNVVYLIAILSVTAAFGAVF